MIINDSKSKNVTGITPEETNQIYNFLQGSVYCWCKNRPHEWFATRDLLGGANFDWNGTPLYVLYNKHINNGKPNEEAIEQAGKEVGWLLKTVLMNDLRQFESQPGHVKTYRWIR